MSPGLKRYVVAAVIVGIHAGGIALLIGTSLRFKRPALPEEEPLYVRYFTPAPRALPPAQETSESGQHAAHPSAAEAPAWPGAPSLLIEPQPPADWDAEARSAAGAVGADLGRREHRKCDDSDKPGGRLPKCKKHAPAFGWSDEHRAGFTSEGLPWVRLGKRCILVAGIPACALGSLPEADGHLFDGMKDPDRDRSSVPGVLGINEAVSATPHRSPVFVDP